MATFLDKLYELKISVDDEILDGDGYIEFKSRLNIDGIEIQDGGSMNTILIKWNTLESFIKHLEQYKKEVMHESDA
jgi:hypothetical protein